MKCFFCRKRHIPSRKFYRPLGSNYPYFSGAKYCSEHCCSEAYQLRKAIEQSLEADAEKRSEVFSGELNAQTDFHETGGKGGVVSSVSAPPSLNTFPVPMSVGTNTGIGRRGLELGPGVRGI